MTQRLFRRYIGVDYSGAETPDSRLNGLRVYSAEDDSEPRECDTAAGLGTPARHMRWNWSRKELAHWLADQLAGNVPIIIGIDHGFSFPDAYFQRYGLKTWDEFLEDFCRHWPTDQDGVYVDDIRESKPARTGRSNEFRMSEKWTPSTQSVFKFDGQGTVGKSSHAGIVWLRFLRRLPNLQGKVHFWPFDGFDVPRGRSVVAEVWPSIFRRRCAFPQGRLTPDQRDAFAVAKWLQEMDREGLLAYRYLAAPVTPKHFDLVRREGWILGVA